jgi:PAS domain S-box-containing protein
VILESTSVPQDKVGPLARSSAHSPAAELDRGNSLAHAIVATVREPLIVLDRNLHVVAASRSFYRAFGIKPAEARGRPFYEVSSGEWHVPALQQLLENVISRDLVIEAYEIELDLPNVGRRRMLLNARQILDEKSPDTVLLLGLEDVTARDLAAELKDAALRQQQTLLLEVQHRVGNSLQIIASILLLKARNVQSAETRFHLKDVHQRVVSVATVQEQLRTSPFGTSIELGPYLKKLCAGLANSMIGDDRHITVTASATAGAVESNEAVSYGLIATELVINAVKHGFPDGREGHIAVDFTAGEQEWRLSVSDDGIGRQHDSTQPIHIGLGTSIVEALSRQLKARVEITAANPGTVTSIIRRAV